MIPLRLVGPGIGIGIASAARRTAAWRRADRVRVDGMTS